MSSCSKTFAIKSVRAEKRSCEKVFMLKEFALKGICVQLRPRVYKCRFPHTCSGAGTITIETPYGAAFPLIKYNYYGQP